MNDNYKMTYLIDDTWDIVKEFMLDWRISWNKRMKPTLENIKRRLPTFMVGERYDTKTKLHHTTYRAPSVRPWVGCGRLESRISSNYNALEHYLRTEARWSGNYSLLRDYNV